MSLLDTDEVADRLAGSHWTAGSASITREWTLTDFAAAIAFVNRVADAAQAVDHHPDIVVHSYNKVRLELSTHSAGGLTEADFRLAAEIDGLA